MAGGSALEQRALRGEPSCYALYRYCGFQSIIQLTFSVVKVLSTGVSETCMLKHFCTFNNYME